MASFTTKLSLGSKAFTVSGGLDARISEVTVGQIRVIETMPKAKQWTDEPCYEEVYMCFETGVGSGTLWKYGHNIFATQEEAEKGVIKHHQKAYKERAERDIRVAEQKARQMQNDLLRLAELKQRYEGVTEQSK